jgi:hypothetical protein
VVNDHKRQTQRQAHDSSHRPRQKTGGQHRWKLANQVPLVQASSTSLLKFDALGNAVPVWSRQQQPGITLLDPMVSFSVMMMKDPKKIDSEPTTTILLPDQQVWQQSRMLQKNHPKAMMTMMMPDGNERNAMMDESSMSMSMWNSPVWDHHHPLGSTTSGDGSAC